MADYYRMLEAGILHEDDRVELLGGQVVEMGTINPPHAATVDRGALVFIRAVGDRVLVRNHNPLDLGEYDTPEPDLALVRLRADAYVEAHPTAGDVLLVVEVADSSPAYDRSTKAALYAAAGNRELWIVNLPDGVLELYRDPGPTGYQDRQSHQRDEQVSPRAFPEVEIAVTDLLPPGRPEGQRTGDQAAEPSREEEGQ